MAALIGDLGCRGHSNREAIGPTDIEPVQTLQMIATHVDPVIPCHGMYAGLMKPLTMQVWF